MTQQIKKVSKVTVPVRTVLTGTVPYGIKELLISYLERAQSYGKYRTSTGTGTVSLNFIFETDVKYRRYVRAIVVSLKKIQRKIYYGTGTVVTLPGFVSGEEKYERKV